MTFVDYIIQERSRRFLAMSLMDMDKCNYKGKLEDWFPMMYEEYKILISMNQRRFSDGIVEVKKTPENFDLNSTFESLSGRL